MRKKLIAKPFSAAGAFDKTGNINKFNRCRRNLFRVIHFRQHIQPVIRHHDDAGIRLNRTERIVFRLSPGVGDRVEQRALSHIGKTYNSQFHKLRTSFGHNGFDYIRGRVSSQAFQTAENMIK